MINSIGMYKLKKRKISHNLKFHLLLKLNTKDFNISKFEIFYNFLAT